MFKYSIFLIIFLIGLSCSELQEQSALPNIVLIISDDQSYQDYGFMNHPHIQTPRIDELMNMSATYTRGYATSPLCSPSLASMISGLYTWQHGITGNDPVVEYEGPKRYSATEGDKPFGPNSYPVKRNEAFSVLKTNFLKNTLLTDHLKQLGYATFQSGKWWIGSAEEGRFDAGMTHGDFRKGGRHGDEGLRIGREGFEPIYHFIEKSDSAERPFFLWYAPFLPHTPHNPPQDLLENYLALAPDTATANYWAMVEWFDQTTGMLLDYLDEKNLSENTIVVYTCDNGWIQSERPGRYAPRSKRSPYEDGIRTPISFKWPGKIVPRFDSDHLVSNVDLVPTILSLLNISYSSLPGINVLDPAELSQRSSVFSEAYHHDIQTIEEPTASLLYEVAISQPWKLILPNPSQIPVDSASYGDQIAGYYSKEAELYHLAKDPGESENLADQYPEIVDSLTREIRNWKKESR